MKKAQKILIIAAVGLLILSAILLRLYGPRSLAELPAYSQLETADALQITFEEGAGDGPSSIQVDHQEAESLLQLLSQGTVRYMGKQPYFSMPAYGLAAAPAEHHDPDLTVTPDGWVQMLADNGESVRHYRLSGCDMAAVERELCRLLGMT